jgi:hypothetical protein
MRFATRLLVPVTTVALVACGAEPVPVAQRFPTAAEAPGSKPDPVEKGETAADLDEFIVAFTPALIDPDREEMTRFSRRLVSRGRVWTSASSEMRIRPPSHISSAGSSSSTLRTGR